jgi:hypothetical protein
MDARGRVVISLSLSLAQVDVRRDLRAPEDLFGVQRVMRSTSDAQIRLLVGAAQRS